MPPSWASDTPTREEVVDNLLLDATVAVAYPNAEPLPRLHARAFEWQLAAYCKLQRPAGSLKCLRLSLAAHQPVVSIAPWPLMQMSITRVGSEATDRKMDGGMYVRATKKASATGQPQGPGLCGVFFIPPL